MSELKKVRSREPGRKVGDAYAPAATFLVDLPDPHNLDGAMVNVGVFESREEAVDFCVKHIGAEGGRLDLITRIDDLPTGSPDASAQRDAASANEPGRH